MAAWVGLRYPSLSVDLGTDSGVRVTKNAPQPVAHSLAGGLLIATPNVRDPFFARSVVLLIDHDGDGAYGVVLNRRADAKLGDLLERLELATPRHLAQSPVWWGGPVQPEAGIVVYLDEPALPRYEPSVDVAGELRVSWSMDLLRDVGEGAGPSVFALYLGSAGWGPAQLEKELEEGAWIPTDLNARLLFRDTPDAVWQDALAAIGAAPSTIAMGDAARA